MLGSILKRFSLIEGDVLKFGVAAILLAVPLYPKFPFFSIPSTYVSIRLEDFLLAALGIAWLPWFFRNRKEFLKDKINQAILLFLVIGFLSYLSGLFLTQTVSSNLLGFLHWLRRIEYLLPFFIGLSVIRSYSDLRFYLSILGIVVLGAFFYGLGQVYLNFPVITTQNYEFAKGIALYHTPGARLGSTFAGHYDLAAFLVLVMPISIGLFFTVKDIRDKIFWSLVFMSGLWLLFMSASRISFVAYLGASVLTLLLIRKYLAIPLILVISIAGLFLSGDLTARYWRVIDVFFKSGKIQRFINPPSSFKTVSLVYAESSFDETPGQVGGAPPMPTPVFEDRSSSIRLNVEWPRALRAFYKNPLLGTGFSSINLATDNDYLRLLGETGILGFMAFLLIFFRLGQRFFKMIPFARDAEPVDSFIASFGAGAAGILVNATLIDVFEASKFAIVFWLIVGFAISTIRIKSQEAGTLGK